MIEQILGAPDGEGRYHDGAAARRRPADDIGDLVGGIFAAMPAVAVSRFEHNIIGILQPRGRFHDWAVRAANVAGEQDRCAAVEGQVDERGAEDMASTRERHGHIVPKGVRDAERDRCELRERRARLRLGVEREGRFVA